jgi:DNA-3-methyladenine glycosylase I
MRQCLCRTLTEVPATSPEGDAVSTALKERGFRFVGPTMMYAMMQAVGMVNDHTVDCFRHEQVQAVARALSCPG